jgi:predicted RNA binding protein YcfA (HicA-like mRNA interferase family)
MKSVSGKELAKLLESRGWMLMRIHGSHHVYGTRESSVRLSVPIHGNRPLKVGLVGHLLKMAGLSVQDL